MRSMHIDLADALSAPGRMAVALCARVQWLDGTVLGFTSWDVDFPYDEGSGAITYKASQGMRVSQIQGNADGAIDNLDAKVLLDSSVITEDDLRAGKWNGARISLFLVNPESLWRGHLSLRAGKLGQVVIDRGEATAEFVGMLQHYLSTIGETVTATCQNEFCGPIDARGRGCGLNIVSYTYSATVTGWDPDNMVIDSASLTGYPNNEFNDGKVTFTAQPWITFGVKYSIQASGIVALKSPPPFTVTPGMTFSISKGCTKERDFCVSSRSNGARFRGFPDLKGNDKLGLFGHRGDS